ncbi:hypothetical protein [uncultured Metabacillus sp.]|uniref:hypothetical protein n=1 Tax=uncultured Metabacillus sp. TaxID=2860135 RepID=UPI0026289C2B|nr:hypothetical protein [uncultured Metabacillus sp.]
MNDYFSYILSNLSLNELSVLGILSDNQANLVFKSMKKKTIQDLSQLSTAKFRKSLDRLEANRFIEIVTNEKEHKIYITEYGQIALNQSLKEEV